MQTPLKSFGSVFASLSRELKLRFSMATAYRQVFGTPEHMSTAQRLVMQDICRFAGINADAFVPGEADSTAYTLGKQRLVRRIAAMIGFTEAEVIRLANLPQHAADQGEAA